MTLPDLLTELYKLGVLVVIEGSQLRLRAKRGVITEDLREMVAAHKAEMISALGDGEHLKHDGPRSFRAPSPADGPATRYVHEGLALMEDFEARGYAESDALRLARQRLGTFADWRAKVSRVAA